MTTSRIAVTVALSTLLITPMALAASVHLKKGTSGYDHGTSLTLSGALAGVGNGDVLVTLTAEADAVVTCTNPAGETQPPGAQPAPVIVEGAVLIPDEQTSNGTTPWSVTTVPPSPNPIPGAPDCPNDRWTEMIVDLAFTSAVLTVEQGGIIVYEALCVIDPASVDGPIASGDVYCDEL